MRIETEEKLDFRNVLIRPKRSTLPSRSTVNLNRRFKFLNSGKEFCGIPIIAANMDTIGTFKMAKKLAEDGLMTSIHKHYALDELYTFWDEIKSGLNDFVFYTMGITEHDEEKFKAFMKNQEASQHLKYLCIDVANGYTERFVTFVKSMRDTYPDLTIMAGNVVTGEMVEELILSGADIVKVGIGPGSVCTTRAMTGVGYPQLSATIECADAAHGLGGQVCADGGCQVPGDIVKAFGGGADFVMLGGMLSGHDECGGQFKEIKGINGELERIMQFYGMSSKEAMEIHSGGTANYRASEGKCVEVPYKGAVQDTVREILGGLRSACTYIGAKNLKELPKRTTFVKVSQQLNSMFV